MEQKQFKQGDLVTITAPHLKGVEGEVIQNGEVGLVTVRITGSDHPSGHSAEGTLVMFPAEQLEPREAKPLLEVEL